MKAEIRIESVVIPTYGTGKPDRNPMFLEKRVYQGSSGKVYPLPVIDKIEDERKDRTYTAVILENEYLRVMILPELGGRIQRATDKTNGYDFVYYNEVIKPALVGLCGPWISGGIEFNWPQHHRPTTFSPVDWHIVERDDGAVSVALSEVDQMYGTKGEMIVTLYPDKAYIEIDGQLYNRTPLPQTFLWWANPAVAVNDDTQSVFPPDVHAVYDHGKRDVSKFPIATGVYYKHDYGAGVDISRYKNIPVPTSYMCAHSDYDFVGGYDYGKEAGILHVADHHVSPGKKQWTWGCGDFGQAWDRNLTDENGPYIELMTGMFCDNQPDFTWLAPFEEKRFTQYFMPYKKAGYVKNANRECAVNLTCGNGKAEVTVYATSRYENAHILLTADGAPILESTVTVSPTEIFKGSADWDGTAAELKLTVSTASGAELIAYAPLPEKIEEIPNPAPAAKPPEEIGTNEELWLTGLHLEQYRHATFLPDPYYLEALKRDPGDSRANLAYGLLLLRRGCFAESEPYFRRAVERMTKRNPNPPDSSAYTGLGLCLWYQDRIDEAFDAFYKATWSSAEQEEAFYYLAAISCRRKDWGSALGFVERSLIKNGANLKARALKGLILGEMGKEEDAATQFSENLRFDPFDYASLLSSAEEKTAAERMGSRVSSYIEAAIDFAEAGFYEKSLTVLALCPTEHPMVHYYRAYYRTLLGLDPTEELRKASAAESYCCFPNRLEDIAVLGSAMEQSPEDARAPYYLGCLWYDKRQYEAAISCWERSAAADPDFPTVWRNLSLAYYNKRGEREKALAAMEKAYALDEEDARVLLELFQLYGKLNRTPEEKLAFLEKHLSAAFRRDDLTVEYVKLMNLMGRHEEALQILMNRKFHPWEGGEGKVTEQYDAALCALGIRALGNGDAAEAKALFEKALVFPHNLGEGKLEGAKDNHLHYWLGLAHRALGNEDAAKEELALAAEGNEEPASSMYYNDQPADRILYEGLARRALGDEDGARSRFYSLISWGEKHWYDEVKIDYFAVSLPDLQLFDDDLSVKNRIHCEYLIALGSLGLGDTERAKSCFDAVLKADPAHQGARFHRQLSLNPKP